MSEERTPKACPCRGAGLTAARREEIVDACAQLYEEMPFKDITLLKIGERTSFTRTSIYNYFQTREEIFLALLEREFAAWTEDLFALAEEPASREAFPERFAALLDKRKCMLKLLSMNLYDMESGSRFQELVAFKKTYGASMNAVAWCVKAHTGASTAEAEQFVYTLYPFLIGVYPYTEATEKQRKAMEQAGIPYRPFTVSELTRPLVKKLIFGFGEEY